MVHFDPAGMIGLVALVGLATRRVCRLVQQDTITERPRAWFYGRWPAAYTAVADKDDPSSVAFLKPTWPGRLVSCPWCLSVWVAAGFTGGIAVGGWDGWGWRACSVVSMFLATVLAAAEVAGLVYLLESRSEPAAKQAAPERGERAA